MSADNSEQSLWQETLMITGTFSLQSSSAVSAKGADIKYAKNSSELRNRFLSEIAARKAQDSSESLKIDLKTAPAGTPAEESILRDNPNPYSAFFSEALTVSKDSTHYLIAGVEFSSEAYSRSKSVLKAAADSLDVGTGRNSGLDYRSHAEISLADSTLATWAQDTLSEDQAKVVTDAFTTHVSKLKGRQSILINTRRYTGASETSESYYGIKRIISNSEIDALSSATENQFPKITGLKSTGPQEKTASTQIATNKSLIEELRSMFAALDVHQKDSLLNQKAAYSQLMAPAFSECGLKTDQHRLSVETDFLAFRNLIDRILGAGSGSQIYEQV